MYLKHKEKKRSITKSYRNSEILKPAMMNGIEERSRAFLRKIEEAEDGIIDVYVRFTSCYESVECHCIYVYIRIGKI